MILDTAEAFAQEFLNNGKEDINTTDTEVKLRDKKRTSDKMQIKDDRTNGTNEHEQTNGNDQVEQNGGSRGLAGDTAALLHRTMGALYEMNPDLEDSHEEIRKLDSQLDHLNEYMDKVEERIREHNDKLIETLKQQKEDREKRRRSFHERIETNRQEEEDFQRQLNAVLSRVGSLRQERKINDDAK